MSERKQLISSANIGDNAESCSMSGLTTGLAEEGCISTSPEFRKVESDTSLVSHLRFGALSVHSLPVHRFFCFFIFDTKAECQVSHVQLVR